MNCLTDGLEQRGRAFGGVGLSVRIARGRGREPRRSVLGAAGSLQGVGVRVPQSGRPGPRMLAIKAATRQDRQGGVQLAEVASGSCDDDEQLGPGFGVELGRGRIVDRSQCLRRTAQRTLAVRDEWQVSGITEDSPSRTQLGQRLGPLLSEVRCDTDSLTNSTDARGTRSCGARVLKRPLRVVVEQLPREHEVSCYGISVRLAERT